MLMFREPERFSGRRLAVDATVAILAFVYSFWMIYGAGQEYIAQGFLLLLAGIPVYVYLKWRQSEAVADIPVEPRRSRPRRGAHRSGAGRSGRCPASTRQSLRAGPRGRVQRPGSASTPRSERCARVLCTAPTSSSSG